jgi:3-dehydroquinate dehydratase/shikimate dehydrogenase
MICISVTPTSRKLAKVDIFNACRMADMVEVCLDHLAKEPDIADMLSAATKPVLVSCRRKADGGQFTDSEEHRLALLRQAIIAGPDYIELDLDIAGSIPRFGKTKRVVSYISLDRPLSKVDDIIAEGIAAKADVMKFTWPTSHLDAAWPLLAICTSKKEVPIVGMALGEGSTMFSLLAHKFGSPWIYAALEQGMEAHKGQPTVWDLKDTYDLTTIGMDTKLVGLLGPTAQTKRSAETLNAGMKAIGSNTRCLPLDFHNLEKLEKRLETLKIRTLVVSPGYAEKIRPLASICEVAVESTGCLDLLLHQKDGWHGYNLLSRSVLAALENKLQGGTETERPLDRRSTLILGTNELARTVALAVTKRKGAVTITGQRDDEAQALAADLGIRFAPLATIYDTKADVLVFTDSSLQFGHRKIELNPAFLQPTMTVADVTDAGEESVFLNEARVRGCPVVDPADIFGANVKSLFKSITGQELPA